MSTIDKQEPTRQKALQLFSYLYEFTRLKSSRPIYDIDDYEDVLWFYKIPREKECISPAYIETTEEVISNWLAIKRPKQPVLPRPPEIANNWFLETDLYNIQKTQKVEPQKSTPEAGKYNHFTQKNSTKNQTEICDNRNEKIAQKIHDKGKQWETPLCY